MNYKMTVTIAKPDAQKGAHSDLTMTLKCSFQIDSRTPYGNKTYLLIADEERNFEQHYDLRYDTSFKPDKKEAWLEDWARNYWSGKNGAYAVKTLQIVKEDE